MLIRLHSVIEIFPTKLTLVLQSFVRNSYTVGLDALKYQHIRGFYHTSVETKMLDELNLLKPSGFLRTTRFKVYKLYMVLALR